VGTLSRRQAHRVRSGESPEPRPLPSLRMERLRIPADAERAGHVSSTLDPLDLLILVHALASAMSPPPPPCAASPPRTRPRPSGSPPHCAAIATAARAITAATPVHEAAGSTTDARTYVRLRQSGGRLTSRLTTFRGPLVAQTSIGRLAQPRGAESASGRKMPANSPVRRHSSPGVVVPDSACHAGGRGFESRRSRLLKCLQIGTLCCQERRAARSRGPNPWPKRFAQKACK
jgi:hypothetical protein